MQAVAEECKNLIAGKWAGSESGRTFHSINPANQDEIIGVFPLSTSADVDKAVKAARGTFDKWRKFPAPRRAEIMFRAGEILVKRKEELARLMTREMGKVLRETRGDIQEGIDMTYYAAGEGRRLLGETTPSELPDKFAMSVRMPIGVVAAITPWNFPLAIPTWKLIPALVCGNTVVFKPASDTPLLATKLVEILLEAGLPEDVLSIVHGTGQEVGNALVSHPDVDLVSFTGSSAAGREISKICADQFKRLSLEMGGKNAIFVMDDADLDLAVEGAVWGAFGTSGQRCTAAGRVIVHKKVWGAFQEKILEKTKKLRLGDGLLPDTDVGPVINEARLDAIHKYTEIGKKEGATLLCGGERHTDGPCARGFFYKPTLFTDVKPHMTIAQEEIFGPTAALIRCDDLEEGISIINGTKYGLSASIYTQDVRNAFTAMRDIYTGITYVNSSTIGAEVHVPFGGTKQTGNGHREAGTASLDTYTEWKTIYVDFSGKLQKAQIGE